MARPEHKPLDPLAPEEGAAGGDAARPPRNLRTAVATIALLFFVAPLVLGLLGVSGGRVPGERVAGKPALSQGWDVFDTGARYFAVQLPGRRRAIRANNWISREVFGTTPVYGVTTADRSLPSGGVEPGHAPTFRGLDGWTFLQADLDRNCHQPVAVGAALRRWKALADAIHASGRPTVLLLAPEKSTIYPERLGSRAINGDCALRKKARMWARIEAARDPYVVGLRRALAARKRTSEQQLYLSVNSHWNDFGAVVLARRALERVGGQATIQPGELVRGRARYASDLSRFTGETEYDTTATLAVSRDGVADPFVRPVGSVAVSTVAATDAPMIHGTTLFVGDSFGDAPLTMLRHYATRMVSVNWQGPSPTELVRLAKRADTVILEAVERSFLVLPSDLPRPEGGSILTPELVSRLRLLRGPAGDPDHAARRR
jgi:alginate O-acetyltransferase complex protein AlgJ